MAFIVKEYFESKIQKISNSTDFKDIVESASNIPTVSNNSLIVDIEGIHVGPTRNFTYYTEQALKDSIPTWTKPYQRPLILHHNEKDGKIIGRVLDTAYKNKNTRSNTGALVFTCGVSDTEGIEGVKDGRLQTVSIGVIGQDVRCSICNETISDDEDCGHERGRMYQGEMCYWVINKMEAKELSYVIVPSDIYAGNIAIHTDTKKKIIESDESSEGELDVSKSLNSKELKEKDEKVVEETTKSEVEETVKDTVEGTDVLKDTIKTLEDTIKDLTQKLEKIEKENIESKKIKENAETELINLNLMLKEFAIEQIFMLRERLNRNPICKEKLEERSRDSLMDTILDLKEEVSNSSALSIKEGDDSVKEKIENTIKETTSDVKITESEDVIEEKQKEVEKIEKVLNESLIDKEKDIITKKDEESEKNLKTNVKESASDSNYINEDELLNIRKFYNL